MASSIYGVPVFHIKKYTGLDLRFRPGSVWVTKAHYTDALPAPSTVWFKRNSHFRLFDYDDLYHGFRYLNHTG